MTKETGIYRLMILIWPSLAKPVNFLNYGLIVGKVDIEAIAFAYNLETTHEIDQIMRIDLALETFYYQHS